MFCYILETTNSSLIGGPGKHPRGFKAFGMMPNIWLPQTQTTSETSFDNPRSPPPYTKYSFLSTIT